MNFQNYFKKAEDFVRPLPVTIVCVMGIIGVVFNLLKILSGSPQNKEIGEWFPFYMVFSTIFSFCCTQTAVLCMFGANRKKVPHIFKN